MDTPAGISNYLETKFKLTPENAGQIAGEILGVEQSLIAGFIKSCEAANLEPEKVTQVVESVREVLFSVIMSGTLSGEKVGEIIKEVKYTPDIKQETAGDETFPAGEMTAYLKFNEGIMLITGEFLKQSERTQTAILRHELGHSLVETTNLFDREMYAMYLETAGGGLSDESISVFEQRFGENSAPLAQLLRTLQKPEENFGLWNQYIQKRLKMLSQKNTPEEYRRVAQELAAEMVGNYLNSGGDEETYLRSRLKFAPEGGYEGHEDLQGNNRRWAEYLRSRFENRGAGIEKLTLEQMQNLQYLEDFGDDYMDDFDDYAYGSYGSENQVSTMSSKGESGWGKFWNWLTKRNKGSKIGGIQKPGPNALRPAA